MKPKKRSEDLELDVFTVSAKDYCEMSGKRLSDYTPVEVHVTDNHKFYGLTHPAHSLLRDGKIPQGAEVVVDLRYSCAETQGDFLVFASGTALVPKEKTEDKK